MTRRPRSAWRRGLAVAVGLAALAGPVLRPALDAPAPGDTDRVEESHDSSRCGLPHDHLACRLVYGSASAPSVPAAVQSAIPLLRRDAAPGPSAPDPASAFQPALPRGPPAPAA